MIYSPDELMRYNNGKIAIVDDIPLLSQWIKKSKSEDLDFLVEVTGLEPAASASRTQRSTKLSHTSIFLSILNFVVSNRFVRALLLRLHLKQSRTAHCRSHYSCFCAISFSLFLPPAAVELNATKLSHTSK